VDLTLKDCLEAVLFIWWFLRHPTLVIAEAV
jgi:hypothetical protein